MSLPQGTHRALVDRMLNRATFRGSISARRPVDAIIDELLRRGAEEVAELATALFLVVLVHQHKIDSATRRNRPANLLYELRTTCLHPRLIVEIQQKVCDHLRVSNDACVICHLGCPGRRGVGVVPGCPGCFRGRGLRAPRLHSGERVELVERRLVIT